MLEKALRAVEGGLVLRVEVSPGSAKDSWAGYDPWREAVKVKLMAEPRGGKANDALTRFIARSLGVPPSRVRVLTGRKSRLKDVMVASLDVESASERLAEVIHE